jgi:hypothetical protein
MLESTEATLLNTRLMLESNQSLVESNEASQHTRITAEWTISVFSPIALSFAYFSMPPALIPFELSVKHFAVSTLFFLIIVRLLFYVFGGQLHNTWLWKAIAARMKIPGLDLSIFTNFFYSTVECFGFALLWITQSRRHPNVPVQPLEGIQLGDLDRSSV